MSLDDAAALDDLTWHWDSAYLITRPRPGCWIAARRDNRETLCAPLPDELLDKIRADYFAFPVSVRIERPEISGGVRSGRGSRFLAEG